MQHTTGLTRLLYDKHAVEFALIDSIIINPQMPAMRPHPAYFWAYELYYSGFTIDLINLFWAIYYDFYVVSNIEFEIYLEEYLEYDYFLSTPKAVGIIIRNMLNLTPTFDVYLAARGWTFTNHPPDLAHVLSCAAFLPIDQATTAVAAFVNVAEDRIAGFIEAVKYGPHTQKVGARRRLFAACFMYEQCDSDDEGDMFIKSYKHASMYDFDFTLVPPSKILSTYRKYDLCDHVFIKELDNGAACGAIGPDWINLCINTPFWSEKICAAGGRIQYNEVVWPSNKASANFITTWGGIDPEDFQKNANSAHFYVNTDKEYRDSLLKLISAAGANAFISDAEAAATTATRSIERIKRPGIQFTPLQTYTVASASSDLSATIANILGETHKDEFGWYMQILSRYELTPESFAGVKYKGLKRFVKNQLKESA